MGAAIPRKGTHNLPPTTAKSPPLLLMATLQCDSMFLLWRDPERKGSGPGTLQDP